MDRELGLGDFRALLASNGVGLSEQDVADLYEAYAFVEQMAISVRRRGRYSAAPCGEGA